jgi:hypothetical protein
LNRKVTSCFVEECYGCNPPIILCNTTIEFISVAEENQITGVWIKGSLVLSRKLLK